MVSKGLYLTLNTININAYYKLPTFLHGTTRKVLFTSDKMYWEVTKSFFPCYFICPGGNGEGWNCVRVQNVLSYEGGTKEIGWWQISSCLIQREPRRKCIYERNRVEGHSTNQSVFVSLTYV